MGVSVWQLAIIVLIVVLLFGTKKLKSLGSDLGESVKGFKKAMKEDDSKDADFQQSPGCRVRAHFYRCPRSLFSSG